MRSCLASSNSTGTLLPDIGFSVKNRDEMERTPLKREATAHGDGNRKGEIGRRVLIPWYHKAQRLVKKRTVPQKDSMVGTGID